MLLLKSSRVLRLISRNAVGRRHASEDASSALTDQQKSQILTLFNKATDSELRQYVGAVTYKRFKGHRECSREFETFEQLAEVGGTYRTFARLCQTILLKTDVNLVLVKSITPALSRERVETIRTVASIHLEPPFLTFSKMDTEMQVLEWKRCKFPEEPRKGRRNIHEAFQLASALYPTLPSADIFIMETIDGPPKDTSLPDKHLLQHVLFTMLSFAEPEQPKVVLMRPYALATYYNLRMGSDRVSCQDLFIELTEKNEIKLPPELSAHYETSNGVTREFLGLSTLYCSALLKTLRSYKYRETGEG